jgi:MFS family permease
VIGPALGLALYELLDHHIRPLLLWALVPAVGSVLLVALVREAPPAVVRPSASGTARLDPQLRRLIALLTVFGLVNFPDALLLLRAHDLGLSTAGVIAAYLVYNLVYAAGSYPAGVLSDRLPRQHVFALGLALFAVGYLGLGLIGQPWLVFVILPLYGGFNACTDGVGKAWVSSLASDDQQARAQGTYQSLSGGAVLVAGLWAGLAWNGDGRLPLLISGAVAVVLALCLANAGRSFEPREAHTGT